MSKVQDSLGLRFLRQQAGNASSHHLAAQTDGPQSHDKRSSDAQFKPTAILLLSLAVGCWLRRVSLLLLLVAVV